MAEIAEALGVGRWRTTPGENADAAIAEVARIFAAIGITPTLAKLGLPRTSSIGRPSRPSASSD